MELKYNTFENLKTTLLSEIKELKVHSNLNVKQLARVEAFKEVLNHIESCINNVATIEYIHDYYSWLAERYEQETGEKPTEDQLERAYDEHLAPFFKYDSNIDCLVHLIPDIIETMKDA